MTIKTAIENQIEIQTKMRLLNNAELGVVNGGAIAHVTHVYAIGRIEPRFPRLSTD
jgi:hypothetical protein